jgi:hypothetical protein
MIVKRPDIAPGESKGDSSATKTFLRNHDGSHRGFRTPDYFSLYHYGQPLEFVIVDNADHDRCEDEVRMHERSFLNSPLAGPRPSSPPSRSTRFTG